MKKGNFFSKKANALIIAVIMLAVAVSPIGNMGNTLAQSDYNYARALQYSLFMYDANMCGTGVDENSLYNWRSNCHVYDAELPLDSTNTNMSESFIEEHIDILDPDGTGTVDVAGGYHDAGDHVKFGMPQVYSSATVGWSYYEFRDAFEETGRDDHIETILRYFHDYYMKVTFLDDDGDVVAFCYQVADGDIDHAYWNAPEVDDMFRRGWFATEELPSTDCISGAATSLAINYFNFKDTDPEYAQKNLDYAIALFDFAYSNEREVNDDGPKGYYTSTRWEDNYCWAAAWLFLATEDEFYLDEAFKYYDYYAPSCWTHCWNDVWVGVACTLAYINDLYDKDSEEFEDRYKEATNRSPYEEINFWGEVEKLVYNWMNGINITITPGGYTFLNEWGSARYNTATQFAALVFDKHNNGGPSEYSEWAKSQMDYLLGDNPNDLCYVVGFSENAVKFPHHRAASGLPYCEDPSPHRFVLYGALVGGPGEEDQHIDETADYIYNEVTIDYNAAFVGAAAGIYTFFGDELMEVEPDFPPDEDLYDDEDGGGGTEYWVDAFATEIVQDDGPKATEVSFYVGTNARQTSDSISVRYYFDASEMTSLEQNDIEMRILYDQTAAETNYEAEFTGPHHYDGDIYYVEAVWDGFVIANSNKIFQFALGTYAWGNYWDPTNDWSYQDLKIEDCNFEGVPERTDYICVYDDGVLVGGIEPDGTTPEGTDPEDEDEDEDEDLDEPEFIYGDLNGDGIVDSTDAVLLSRYILEISDQLSVPIEVADLNGDGEINSTDQMLLSRYLLEIIGEFPVESN
ncbi:glycoside hydrolase family 9 protein [Herbivorax sp. ANBcel31]|uniref:glycoside hydrolase family 9 protein n=1 Tax=Herbivorax sp. ANBcel31 TaxID=3069754 RepID=UPI0027B6A56B|nr:glycoside hydrolase family 9 protein [Herbivorax sp. ANBcel31]MDQ2087217.1 glycoside hydrolase family 9 protein [Herbivorax sp. ANBcel31]